MFNFRSNLLRYMSRAALMIALVSLAILAASAVIAHRQMKTYDAAYRLVFDDGAEPTPAQLDGTAGVVRRRLDSLAGRYGLKHIEVTAQSPDVVRLKFRSGTAVADALTWATLRGRAEFCLLHPEMGDMGVLEEGEAAPAGDKLPDGYCVRTYHERLYRLSRPGDTVEKRHRYMVSTAPLVTTDGFADVQFGTEGWHKRTVVTFTLGEEAAEEFRRATALNVGRQMVLLVDDFAFFPAREIQSTIAGGRVQIQGYFHNPPLRILVSMLQAGALPGRLVRVEAAEPAPGS